MAASEPTGPYGSNIPQYQIPQTGEEVTDFEAFCANMIQNVADENTAKFQELAASSQQIVEKLRNCLNHVETDTDKTGLANELLTMLGETFRPLIGKFISTLGEGKKILDAGKAVFVSHLTNHFCYSQKINLFVDNNINEIVNAFKPLGYPAGQYSFTCAPISGLSETHNGGEQPYFILFSHEETKETFRVVYKPREATVDKTIIKAFMEINERFELNQLGLKLPTYQILSFSVEKCSIWEFIDGQVTNARGYPCESATPDKKIPKSRSDYKSRVIREFFQKTTLACQRAWKLEHEILKRLDIGDQTRFNFIFVPSCEKPLRVFPIDMEVCSLNIRDKFDPILLHDIAPEHFNLTHNEELFDILIGYQHELACLPRRVVPIHTESLSNFLSNSKLWESACTALVQALHELDYQIYDETRVKCCLIRDFARGDVPFFVEKDNKLYAGAYDLVPIGEKR